MKKDDKIDLHFWFLIFISVVLAVFYWRLAFGSGVRTLNLNNKTVARVSISTRGTVLSFPTKPTEVSLGNKGAFGLKYVNNDIIISSLTKTSRSNMFVYLEGRRFTFDLSTSQADGNQIILVRDQFDETVKVKIK